MQHQQNILQENQVQRIRTKFPKLNGIIPPNPDEKTKLLQWKNDLEQNGISVNAHVRLFVQEFVDHVNINLDLPILFQQFASDKMQRFVKWSEEAKNKAKTMFQQTEKQAEEEGERTLKRDLFMYVSNRPDPDAIIYLLVIIARCKKVDPQAYAELHLNKLPNIYYYAKLYASPTKRMVDKIRTVLEPKHILSWFKEEVQAHSNDFDALIERIEYYYDPEDHTRREIETAACLFTRGLVHCTDGADSARDLGDWYYHFLKAMLSHGDCRMFPRFIDPNYSDDLIHWEARKNSATCSSDSKFMSDVIIEQEEEEDGSRMPRDQQNYLEARKTDAIYEFEPDTFDMRPYQNELVMHANAGRNTIICAPTGSGKTYIAVEIIKTHLAELHRDGKVGRCVMLVPTVPLVDQQCLQFVTYLSNFRDPYRPEVPYWIDAFSGCENGSEGRANRVLSTDICVMTPQILINMMNSVLRKEKLYFSDFTLLIFDECHHCDKGHPYKILMEMLQKEWPKLAHKPQIVGLTASMGVGEGRAGWDMSACRNHMLGLCSNLMADSISTVRHQIDDLRNYVVPPVDHVIRVSRPKFNPFVDVIDRVMLKIEEDITGELKELIKVLKITEEDIRFPSHNSPAHYQTMVGTLKKHVNRIADSNKRFLLVRSIDHLSHYFHAIVISDLLPNKYGLEYLEAKMANYQKTASADQIEEINSKLLKYFAGLYPRLKEWSDTENIGTKEILRKLYEELERQFKKEPESRCMIFVATRNCAQKLAHHLNQVENLPIFYQKNNIGFMVSSNQSGSAGGQSSQEQQRMRQDFNLGKIKVLVVTSVAEEGLDIAACNLIIKYNNIGSERTMIQRRGRARQKNSRSVLLALDSNIEQSEFNNIRKEAMMMACIQNLQETSDSLLKIEIQRKRESLLKIQEEMDRREIEKRERLKGRRYNLTCRSCGQLICQSTMIRSVADSLFTVVDPEVWKRSKFDCKINPTKDQLTTKIARWLCGKCNTQEWGTIVKYSNCWLPQLTASNFTMDRLDSQTEYDQVQSISSEGSRRTWALIQEQHFNIDPINLRNIRDMFTGLMQFKPEDAKAMDQQEWVANLKQLEKMDKKRDERKNKIQLFLEE